MPKEIGFRADITSALPDVNVPQILRKLADRIESGVEGYFTLFDTNGNHVGSAFFETWENDNDTL